MDWLNLHISVLDSPQVLRCDPVRRATWLFLLRYCIGQENSGVIADCRAWGDTTWQQLARVKLKEVNTESPLWSWDGDCLRVSFYPTEKETEVQAKRELARTNGRRGGRPKITDVGSDVGSDGKPTSVNSPKAEGNGMEGEWKWNGREVKSAAAPPPAREDAAADPLSMDQMQAAPAPRPHVPPKNFADWRAEVATRIFWTRDEDATWRAVFAAEGWDEMTKGYRHLAALHPPPKKIFLSMFQELRT